MLCFNLGHLGEMHPVAFMQHTPLIQKVSVTKQNTKFFDKGFALLAKNFFAVTKSLNLDQNKTKADFFSQDYSESKFKIKI